MIQIKKFMVKKKLDEEAQSNPKTREKNLKKRFKKKRFKKKGQKRKRVFKSRKIGRLQKKLRIN